MRIVLFSLLLACTGFAQEMPGPAAELARYDRLLGTWEGRGTVNMPGAEGVAWTSKAHTRRVLNGHYLRTDMRVDVQGDMPGTLAFITFYGYDRERQRFTFFEVSNMGMLKEGEILWVDDDTMMTLGASTNQGEPMLERWITTLGDGSHDFVSEHARGTGPWGVHVRGSAKKKEQDAELDLSQLGPFFVQQGPEMREAAKLAGSYRFTGKLRMGPEAPEMEIAGTEDMRMLFGGTVIEFHVKGQPMDYEGIGFLVHDHVLDHYLSFGANTMGMGDMSNAWRKPEGWIFLGQGLMGGQPVMNHMVVEVDEQGRMKRGVGHSTRGASPPYKSFEGTYERVQAAGTARPAGATRDGE